MKPMHPFTDKTNLCVCLNLYTKEKRKKIDQTYKVNDLVLVKNKQSTKYNKETYNGPWTIQEVQDNRTVKNSKGPVSDVYNIQNITPYVSQP